MSGFLNDCCKIELMASQIYHHFALHPEFPEELQQTFRQLALDEEAHARQFDLALELPPGMLGDVKRVAGEKVLAGLDMARALFQDLQVKNFDAEKALRTAMKLEEAFVRIHLENSCVIRDEKISALFSGLARGDEEHLQTLRDAVIWWKKHRDSLAANRSA